MSPCLEYEDKHIENAIEKACRELNIPREEIVYDVISYGSTGIFGLVGVKKAKIRVTLPENHESKRKDNPKTCIKENDLEKTAHTEEIPEDQPIKNNVLQLPEDPKALGRDVLQRIIDFITSDATISVEEDNERLCFNVQGGNSAVLIGKRGQTLEAIQYLVEKIVNKHNEPRIRVQVDIEGYLNNRRENLTNLASRLAEKAKRTGKPITIGQMNAHDRRIVHIALKDDNGVRTQSMGDGFYRKLVVFPKRHSKRNR